MPKQAESLNSIPESTNWQEGTLCILFRKSVRLEESRRMSSSETLNFLTSLMNTYHPSCLFLIETKCKQLRMTKISRKLGFNHCTIVEASGLASGIVLMWRD